MRPRLIVEIGSSSSFVPSVGTSSGGSGFPKWRSLIENFSYKPGYELHLSVPEISYIKADNGERLSLHEDGVAPYAHLNIRCYIPDSTRPPHDLTLIQFQAMIPRYMEDQEEKVKLHYLREILREFEMHEVDEWSRYKGKLVNDPHAPKE